MAILKQTAFGVDVRGQIVLVQLGNVPVSMDYETALQLSQFLRVAGRRAKRNAGDTSMEIKTVARLTDASVDEAEWQRLRDGTAAYGLK